MNKVLQAVPKIFLVRAHKKLGSFPGQHKRMMRPNLLLRYSSQKLLKILFPIRSTMFRWLSSKCRQTIFCASCLSLSSKNFSIQYLTPSHNLNPFNSSIDPHPIIIIVPVRAEIDMKIKAEMENKDSIKKTERKRGIISRKSSKNGILIFCYSIRYFMVLYFNKFISKLTTNLGIQ